MPHDYPGNPAITLVSPPVFQHPSDNDARAVASVNAASEQEADYIASLIVGRRVTASFIRWYTGMRYQAHVHEHWSELKTSPPFWTQGNITDADSGGDRAIQIPCDFPDGASLTGLDVWIAPDVSHTDVPDTLPMFELWVRNLVTGGASQIITKVDPSSIIATYNVPHAITSDIHDMPGGVAHVVDRSTNAYIILFRGEYATHARVDLILRGAKGHFTSGVQDQGAG